MSTIWWSAMLCAYCVCDEFTYYMRIRDLTLWLRRKLNSLYFIKVKFPVTVKLQFQNSFQNTLTDLEYCTKKVILPVRANILYKLISISETKYINIWVFGNFHWDGYGKPVDKYQNGGFFPTLLKDDGLGWDPFNTVKNHPFWYLQAFPSSQGRSPVARE